jgi:hopene-associated glycosyltransferase HpnB
VTATLLGWLGAAGGGLWLALLALPWRPWGTAERIEPDEGAGGGVELSDVAVLIPARDEAAAIGRTLRALSRQGRGLEIVVVDDQSRDGTALAARASGVEGLRVVAGAEVPEGWCGKPWALEQGLCTLGRPFVLLLDADIALAPGMLAAVRAKQRESGAALVSVMARLRMESAWERLLIPAFVYFFKLLYPFRLSNGPGRWVAAGAGGCMLVERSALEAIGGFAAVRGALIDDCALARAIKGSGRRIWIGLSHGVTSHRPYRGLGPIWEMVARTAYTQLGTSPKLLLACTAVMLLAFWAPLAGALFGAGAPRTVAALGLAAMALSYQPVLRFYRRSPAWAAALPLIGTLYLAMTWDSALRCWRGERSRWKGRSYAA